MGRHAWKWLGIGCALAFLVLFGLEMSTTGIERIYGPIEGEYAEGSNGIASAVNERYESETDKRIAELERELEEVRRLANGDGYMDEKGYPRLPGVPYEDEEPAVNKLADSTSGMLQSASSAGIRFVVSLFDGLLN
ncbi:hypothetical protein D3P08_07595 [Paenibacillus nanensis]|uniref:Uncharacterized protein n=1 Tax=Paenibacillus nanensis TaxID=393251 RepID=A0A3A1V633_9BACL|nr:hypothetical protein [Paenibacillus nanensis]RIX54103.1 hypothetical protein D3P08_07595 [Paenibacillus nanensis]